MSSSLDTAFERLLSAYPSYKQGRECADQMLDGGMLYRFNRSVLCVTAAPAGLKLDDGVPVPLSGEYGLLAATAEKLRPELVFLDHSIPLSCNERELLAGLGKDLYMVPAPDRRQDSILFCTQDDSLRLNCVLFIECPGMVSDKFKCRPYRVSAKTLSCMAVAGIDSVCLVPSRLGGAAVLRFGNEAGSLFVFLEHDGRKESLSEVAVGDTVLRGFGWSDEDVCFKRLEMKRRTRMNGLMNPIAKLAADAAVELGGAKEAASEKAAEAQVLEQPSESETAREQPQAKPSKTRKQVPVLTPADYHRITESLGLPVSVDVDGFDAAQEETRALRDLVIVASRRMANLSIALHKVARESVDKYSAIQKLMVSR